MVNQRVQATLYMTSDGARGGLLNLAVWMDDEQGGGPGFVPPESSWRGWDGAGLSADERQYVAAALYVLALRVADHG
ncbi:MAG: hypothetical protein C0498_01530 [Anaerolinea sp.]|nr:hypothetical protein [Anaerolinea sp.]